MVKNTGQNSIFGNFVYNEIIAKDHPIRKLKELINWEYFGKRLMRKYKGGGELGRAPYDPTLMIKMLFIKHIYDLDDRGAENWCMDSLSARFFLDLAVNELSPDHTTLFKFRRKLEEKDLEILLQKILVKTREKGIALGKAVIVDSTDISSFLSDEVDEDTERKGGRDKDARWMSKITKVVKDGEEKEEKYSWFGYKEHTAVDSEHGLFLHLKVTPANVYDGHYFKDLIKGAKDKIFPIETATADRGYDDGELFEWCHEERINPAIRMKNQRMKYKKWRDIASEPWYKENLKQRFRVEQTNAIQKNHAGAKSRAIGLKRTNIYCWLTALAVNIKRILKLIYGINFKTTINRANFCYINF